MGFRQRLHIYIFSWPIIASSLRLIWSKIGPWWLFLMQQECI